MLQVETGAAREKDLSAVLVTGPSWLRQKMCKSV